MDTFEMVLLSLVGLSVLIWVFLFYVWVCGWIEAYQKIRQQRIIQRLYQQLIEQDYNDYQSYLLANGEEYEP